MMGKSDLLPKDRNNPTGKQNIKQKNETMKVNDNPPQAPVSTHSNACIFPNSINSSLVELHNSSFFVTKYSSPRHVLPSLTKYGDQLP